MEEYNLAQDHEATKRQIKDWELRIDALLNNDDVMIDSVAGNELAVMSEEMMSINI